MSKKQKPKYKCPICGKILSLTEFALVKLPLDYTEEGYGHGAHCAFSKELLQKIPE